MEYAPTSAKGLVASREGLSPDDLIRARHGLSLLLVFLSLVALADMELAHSFLFGLTFLVVLVSIVSPMRVSRLPSVTFKILSPLILIFALLDFISSGRDILPPLIRLLFLLVIFRTLAPRRNREEFQLLLISLFLLVIAGVFTLSLQFAVQLIAFAPLALCLLMLMNLIESLGAKGRFPDWEGFRWRDFLVRVRASCNRWTFGLASFIFIGFFSVSALIFLLIPRVNLDHSVPFFQLPGSTSSGFSDTMSLGDVTDITLDDSVAFRVDSSSMGTIPSLPYWRMLVLDRYRPGRFELSDATDRGFGRFSRQSQVVSVSDLREADEGHPGESLTFYFEGGISKYLPMPGAVEELRFQNRQEMFFLPALSVRHLRNTLSSVFFFQVRGFAFSTEFAASDHDDDLQGMETLWLMGAEAISDSLQLDYPKTTLAITLNESEDREYLEDLVRDLRGDLSPEKDPREFATVVAAYLSENHGYTLSPELREGPGDPVLDWIRSGGPGHCEYFAAAFSLILRAAGIPSRVVVGFMGGSINPYENYFVVRNRHAHAWVEYFDGSAWVRADPTPGNEAASGEEDGAFAFAEDPRGFGNWVDSLRVIWYRRVVNFDEQDQSDLVAGFRAIWDNWRDESLALVRASVDWVRNLFLEWKDREWGKLFMMILLVAAVTLVGAALRYRYYLWLLFRRRGRLGVVIGANRRLAGGLLGKIESFQIESRKDDAVTADLRRIRYGPKETWPHPPETFRMARKYLRAVRRRFRNGEFSPQAQKLNTEKSGEPLMDTDREG